MEVAKKETPLVSVIMPAYNAERFIREAIESVQEQTMADWELLVVDDASSDNTVTVVEEMRKYDPRIKLIKCDDNIGVAKARNLGWDCCKGQYIAFLDSDDLWLPEKLEKQLKKMQFEDAAISYCSYEIIDSTGCRKCADYLVPVHIAYDGLLKENIIGCSSVVLDAQKVGMYRFQTDFFHEDYVLWLHILKDGYTATGCIETLVKWRRLEGSRSFNKVKAAKNRWIVYRKAMRLPVCKSVRCMYCYAMSSMKKYYLA